MPKHASPNGDDHDDMEATLVRNAMVQHAIAMTLRQICSRTGGDVQLLAQDPDHIDEAKEILKRNGISVVGDWGWRLRGSV